jgi:transposase
MEQKNLLAIQYDHKVTGLSYRTLAEKYGISRNQVHRLVMSKEKKRKRPELITWVVKEEMALPDDPVLLKEQLRQALLKIELQDLMLDISSKELGIDLRKKHGTRRSK